ncbi:2-oxoacid:acceptor oxidoreductase subunit alpha [candidate division KSB1 bacterium]|nr:2-oxoacid:acceptor oxidoreductase subunit alpha [bacterium]RKY80057.1 MAG: 2-oxoacid:acceptor oxidoreductase subunit alpha [candidate division KSB1 bacterium]RKY89138.1 MAG: 2-oxoacid:acceptor oxidoreductase subunit alpha [candidate division KSB1 bacterium]
MKANPKDVFSGTYYIDGDVACAYGAAAAGCKFLAGYPITPSTEAAEAFAKLAPQIGAMFIQMEDELGSIVAVLGASWAGKKSMTITSGPGFSLMMEGIGFGAALETPFVIINIQRGGPSTGVPTRTGQADMMQARWGSHGDYEIIALSPDSPQESFEFTIKAFNLAERYRVPVMLMSDECVGHMTEKVVIPSASEIEVEPRRFYHGPKDQYLPFKPDRDLVPPMVKAGEGYRLHLTGLVHDENGYPLLDCDIDEVNQKSTTRRLVDKIRANADKIIEIKEDSLDDAEVVVVSYGITSRVALKGIEQAREYGIKVGSLRLVTVWPFPEKRITELAHKIKGFVVPEINYGQIVFEVERCSHGKANVVLVPHGGAGVHNPDDIFEAIKQVAKNKEKYEGVVEYRTSLERLIFG